MTARPRRNKNRPSDAPPDLRAERETFVRTFLHKGVELTEDLLRENQGLEAEARRLRDENTRLRAQLASNDAIRELLTTVEALERERNSLLNRSDELENAARQTEARYRNVEQELNDLASLYVASFQLSNTLSVRRVLRHLCELLEQLIGAQSFAIYVLSIDGKRARLLSGRGKAADGVDELPVDDASFLDACLTGVPKIHELEERDAAAARAAPLAVLPLSFDGEVVGVITIHELLSHKRCWALVDRELFKLVCAHGAAALIAANLYEAEAGPRAALDGVVAHAAQVAQSLNPSEPGHPVVLATKRGQ